MSHTFVDATTVTPDDVDPYRWHAHLDPGWDTPGGIHGGVLLATAVRAAMRGVDRPDLTLRVAHAVFLAPPSHDLFFDVTILRQGKGSAHVRALGTCANQRHPAIDVTVVLTSDRESPSFGETLPPGDVPPPDGLRSSEGGPLGGASGLVAPPLFDHLEVRTAVGRLPWDEGWSADQGPRHARWARYVHRPALADGTYDPIALLPLADLPGPSIWQRFGPDEPVLFFMSLDLSLNFLEPVTDEWVLTDIRARRLGEGHAFVETDLWSGDRLVATSAQTMLVRTVLSS
jgi:acyl-CoA thioesterase